MTRDRVRVLSLSVAIGLVFVLAWQAFAGNRPPGKGLPGPLAVGATAWQMLAHPFYDHGPNDKGIGLQLGASLGRLALGYLAASAAAVMLCVARRLSPLLPRGHNTLIHGLQPRPPLPGIPLLLHHVQEPGPPNLPL